MNQTLKEMVEHKPRLPLSADDQRLYKGGLLVLSLFTSENFMDIPQLPSDRFDHDGLFYTIPHLHSSMLGHTGNTRTLLVVYKVENKSSFCPYRFEFDYTDEKHFRIYLCDQSGNRTVKHIFIEREGSDYYSAFDDTKSITLATLESMLAAR